MAQRSLQNARILLTGASSGIGRALALELARRGARLFLTARRRDRLASLTEEIHALGAEADFLEGDIGQADFRKALVDRVAKHWSGKLDGLINGAGIGFFGLLADATLDEADSTLQVNLLAPMELCRLALPLLRQGQTPLIVNVGSVLGHVPAPRKATYVASKYGLRGFSNAIRLELAPDGIDVLLVSPSTTATEFFDSATSDPALRERIARRAISPEEVARQVARAMERGKREIILSIGGRAIVRLHRIARWLAERLMMRFAD